MNINFIKTHKFCMVCIGVLVLLILLNLLFGSSSPVPYYPDNIFAKQFPYTREGMDGVVDNEFVKTVKKEGYKSKKEGYKDKKKEEGYEDKEEEGYEDKEEEGYEDKEEEEEGYEDLIPHKKSKEGFKGLPSGSFNNEQYIGYLANVKTGVDCGGSSNGYSNSTGYFCFSPDELRYLQSRGGNATSKGDF